MTTHFNEAIATVTAAPEVGHGCYTAEVTSDWLQGRAAFGGLMSAFADSALRQELENLDVVSADADSNLAGRPLRSMMTAFIGPPSEGKVDIRCEILRSGKSVTWAEVRITQAEKVCTTVTAAFGGARTSSINVAAKPQPKLPAPADCEAMPFAEGLTPNFTQHFEMRWAQGKMPVSSATEPRMAVWVRFRNAPGFTEAHLVAMMDVLPPAVLSMFKEMKPISSLTWNLEVIDSLKPADIADDNGWWRVDVHADASADGYSQQQATLYTPTGRAIAYSRQTIAVFA